jgi:predicted RNA-binding Zn-ribbon protein involved in translation (DUF1610 family)
MNRPDIEKYEAMAAEARGDIVGYLVTGRGPAAKFVSEGYTAIPELCAYIRHMEAKIDLYMNGREAARRCPECGKAMVRRPDAQGAWCIYRCFGCGHVERDLGICVERAKGAGK